MPISRGQTPRQLYGLGSFVKSIGKAVKGAVKGVTKAAKSPLGMAAIALAFPQVRAGLGSFFGRGSFNPLKMLGTTLPGQASQFIASPFGQFLGTGTGKAAAIGAASLVGGMLTPKAQEDVQALRQSGDRGLLQAYLRQYYGNLNPNASAEDIEEFVRTNSAEGGRIGYQEGGIMPRLNQLGSGVSSAEQMLEGINQRLESAESSLGGGGAMQQPIGNAPFMGRPALTEMPGYQGLPSQPSFTGELKTAEDAYANAQKEAQKSRAGGFLGQVVLPGEMSFEDFSNMFTPSNNFGQPMPLPPGAGLGGMQSPISSAMRNMAAGGGMMGRQMYGLGSLVKSIGKAAKGVVKGVKKVAKSPIGKAAMLYFAPALIPGGASTLGGVFSNMGGLAGLKTALIGSGGGTAMSTPGILGKLGITGGGGAGLTKFGKALSLTVPAVLAAAGVQEDEVEAIGQDKNKLAALLERGYKNLNQNASDEEVQAFVRANVAEGGRMGFAMGPDNPERNAMQASGIMGLPLNENPAGITELDLRETGGFIPPVGVKEKADDIPAMLSNNEFVFTADAVRGMGDRDVNKGAERMYAMMKTLENGGRV